MRPTNIDFKQGDVVAFEDAIEQFTDWYAEFKSVIHRRLLPKTFSKIVSFVTRFDEKLVSRMLDSEIDEQLVFCSQYCFTLSHIRDEIDLYRRKVQRGFEMWMAGRSRRAHEIMLGKQAQEVPELRTKANYDKISKDDVKYYVMDVWSDDYMRWHEYIEKVERSYLFVRNLVFDIERRAITLTSILKYRHI